MTVGPPDLRREPDRVRVRGDRAREQQALAERHRLRLEALLLSTASRSAEVGRDHHAGHDLDAVVLELRDLGRVVGGAEREAARVDERVAGRRERRREAHVGSLHALPSGSSGHIAPTTPPGATSFHIVDEDLDHVLEPPEEVVVPLGSNRRRDAGSELAADSEVVRLPRRVVGQHGNLVVSAGLDDRHGGVGRLGDAHQSARRPALSTAIRSLEPVVT